MSVTMKNTFVVLVHCTLSSIVQLYMYIVHCATVFKEKTSYVFYPLKSVTSTKMELQRGKLSMVR